VKFLVLLAEDRHFDRWEAATEQEHQAFFDGLAAFTAKVEERGKVLGGEALDRPQHAVTVRDGAVTQGPFAETVEQLGGFYLVELPTVEDAVEAAKLLRVQAAELRPVLDM
jgi:hypothetical protein